MSDLIERVKEIKRNIDNIKDRVDRFKQFYEDYQKNKKLRIKIYKNRERNFKKVTIFTPHPESLELTKIPRSETTEIQRILQSRVVPVKL